MKFLTNKLHYLSKLFLSFGWFILAFLFILLLILLGFIIYNNTILENVVAFLGYSYGATITLFILDGFKYSNYFLLRVFQKLYIFFSLSVFSVFAFIYLYFYFH